LKLVATAWKKLSGRERAYWDEEARSDKLRFVREKAEYKGVWTIPKRRAKKHPLAPKRPMSAFLKYSQTRRAKVKEENPDMSNTDVSRLLGEMWRNASKTERAPYVEVEEEERAQYKEEVKRWRQSQARMDADTRTSHDAVLTCSNIGDFPAPMTPVPSYFEDPQAYHNFEPLRIQSVEDAINKADQRMSSSRHHSPTLAVNQSSSTGGDRPLSRNETWRDSSEQSPIHRQDQHIYGQSFRPALPVQKSGSRTPFRPSNREETLMTKRDFKIPSQGGFRAFGNNYQQPFRPLYDHEVSPNGRAFVHDFYNPSAGINPYSHSMPSETYASTPTTRDEVKKSQTTSKYFSQTYSYGCYPSPYPD
jgi:hypothetical protein